MRLPRDRGLLSKHVLHALQTGGSLPSGLWADHGPAADLLHDEDAQLTLWVLYELHYRGFDDAAGDLEWDPALLELRAGIEAGLERELRAATAARLRQVPDSGDVGEQLLAFVAADDGPSTAAYLQRSADRAQFEHFLRQRSIYHLKEADPHTFVVPRIDGAAKAALAELQYDEYGGGRAPRLHATMFGDAMEACGLDRTYGAYVDEATALTLAVNNQMSLFALHRRLRGAALGHLAAFEATSSVPARKIAGGAERLGLPEAVAAYYSEHVEADSAHEQVAARDICGGFVAEQPGLRGDVFFGAAACLHLDGLAAQEMLDHWEHSS
jgi:hypothetical protein